MYHCYSCVGVGVFRLLRSLNTRQMVLVLHAATKNTTHMVLFRMDQVTRRRQRLACDWYYTCSSLCLGLHCLYIQRFLTCGLSPQKTLICSTTCTTKDFYVTTSKKYFCFYLSIIAPDLKFSSLCLPVTAWLLCFCFVME